MKRTMKIKRGWQSELARLSGCSRYMVSLIASGKRKPSATLALKLYKASGVHPMAWLYPETYMNPLIKDGVK
jgi:transcriptional regulator with XRE-family HTH domain